MNKRIIRPATESPIKSSRLTNIIITLSFDFLSVTNKQKTLLRHLIVLPRGGEEHLTTRGQVL